VKLRSSAGQSHERRLDDSTCAVTDGSCGVSAAGSQQLIYRFLVDANVLRTVFVSVEQNVPADCPVNEESSDSMKQSLSISP
jgi:hypothetical protein